MDDSILTSVNIFVYFASSATNVQGINNNNDIKRALRDCRARFVKRGACGCGLRGRLLAATLLTSYLLLSILFFFSLPPFSLLPPPLVYYTIPSHPIPDFVLHPRCVDILLFKQKKSRKCKRAVSFFPSCLPSVSGWVMKRVFGGGGSREGMGWWSLADRW